MTNQNKEIFGPEKINIKDIIFYTSGAFISGFVGSILLIFIIVFAGFIFNSSGDGFNNSAFDPSGGVIFPIFISFLSFFITLLISYLIYLFLGLINPEKFKRTYVHLSQIILFSIILFVIIIPIYSLFGVKNNTYMIYIFIFHVIFIAFGTILILELLNNYRYILLSFYSSFFGLGLTIIISSIIFFNFNKGLTSIYALLFLPALVNGLLIFFKGIFEYCYYTYFNITGSDPLGEIFEKIKEEELEEIEKETELRNIF